MKMYAEHRQLMAQIENQVLEEQVVDWLLEKASVTDQSVAFSELMESN
jgi:FKBP-type peptidyl-prolyl cis-trans isomerase (trigger factor)